MKEKQTRSIDCSLTIEHFDLFVFLLSFLFAFKSIVFAVDPMQVLAMNAYDSGISSMVQTVPPVN
jgi:hypothetical protein